MPEYTFEEIGTAAGEPLDPTAPAPMAPPAPATPTQPAPVDLNTIKIEGEGYHEMIRGKSVAEVARMFEGAQTALRLSEESRRSATQSVPSPAPNQAGTPPADAEPTDEQIRAAMEEDQMKGYQMMLDRQQARTLKAFEQRLQPLQQGGAVQAEALARTQFKEEFEVLGKEIQEFIDKSIPDKNLLAQPGAYERVVKYVRGEHMDKIFEARNKKASNDTALAEARRRESQNIPANLANGQNEPRVKLGELDDVQKEIARVQGITHDEYRKYFM